MLYDTVKSPQNSSTHYKELVMKCIWKIVKDFQEWGDELCYERVLAHIHRFLKVCHLYISLFLILHFLICHNLNVLIRSLIRNTGKNNRLTLH